MLAEEHRLTVFETTLLTGCLSVRGRNLRAIGENYTLRLFMTCASPDIAIKSRNMRWVGHMERNGGDKYINIYIYI